MNLKRFKALRFTNPCLMSIREIIWKFYKVNLYLFYNLINIASGKIIDPEVINVSYLDFIGNYVELFKFKDCILRHIELLKKKKNVDESKVVFHSTFKKFIIWLFLDKSPWNNDLLMLEHLLNNLQMINRFIKFYQNIILLINNYQKHNNCEHDLISLFKTELKYFKDEYYQDSIRIQKELHGAINHLECLNNIAFNINGSDYKYIIKYIFINIIKLGK